MTSPRIHLGNAHGFAQRRRIYRSEEGLEVEEVGGFELTRRRLLWNEIRLVTLHRGHTSVAVWVLGGLALTTLSLGLFLGPLGWPSYSLYGIGVFCGIASLWRLAPCWVVTVFARRFVTDLRFRLREERARRTYDEICRLTAESQAVARDAVPRFSELPPELPADPPTA